MNSKLTDYVEWVEPFFESEPVIMKITVATAIRFQKAAAARINKNFVYKSDEEALEDFLVVHWAKLINNTQ